MTQINFPLQQVIILSKVYKLTIHAKNLLFQHGGRELHRGLANCNAEEKVGLHCVDSGQTPSQLCLHTERLRHRQADFTLYIIVFQKPRTNSGPEVREQVVIPFLMVNSMHLKFLSACTLDSHPAIQVDIKTNTQASSLLLRTLQFSKAQDRFFSQCL